MAKSRWYETAKPAGQCSPPGSFGRLHAEAAMSRANEAFLTVTTVGNVKRNWLPGAWRVTISRSTRGSTWQRYAPLFVDAMVEVVVDDAFAHAARPKAAIRNIGTTALCASHFIGVSIVITNLVASHLHHVQSGATHTRLFGIPSDSQISRIVSFCRFERVRRNRIRCKSQLTPPRRRSVARHVQRPRTSSAARSSNANSSGPAIRINHSTPAAKP